MLNLSRHSNNQDNFSDSELKDFGYQMAKRQLPRHISSLESRKRHQAAYPNLLATPSSGNKNKAKQIEESNLAVNILTYQLKDNAAKQKHLANLRSNLQHRFEVAKAAQDSQLMTMLQQEFKQLSAI